MADLRRQPKGGDGGEEPGEAGLPVNPATEKRHTLGEVFDYCERWQQRRHQIDYEIDGTVALIERGWVADPADVYFVTAAQLEQLPGFGPKSVRNLLGAIEGSKSRPLSKLLVALNLRQVGATAARILARVSPSIDQLESASLDELMRVPGIGREIARSVHDWFREPAQRELVDEPKGGDRGRGARRSEVSSSVSRTTDFLVAGVEAGKTKLEKARFLGVEIVDEPEFLRRLGAPVEEGAPAGPPAAPPAENRPAQAGFESQGSARGGGGWGASSRSGPT